MPLRADLYIDPTPFFPLISHIIKAKNYFLMEWSFQLVKFSLFLEIEKNALESNENKDYLSIK